MSGHHRADAGEVRVRNRCDRLRRHDVPLLVRAGMWLGVVVDRVRLPWRDLRLRATDAWSRWVVPAAVAGIDVCQTCRQKEHRACGWLIDDPACGCHCVAAAQHRAELATLHRLEQEMGQQDRTVRALNIVAKWRNLFAGWQLGTRPKGDPEGDAVRDHREATILLRVEVSALSSLLHEKGAFTDAELLAAVEREANKLNTALERRYPGVTASENGLTFDKRALPWMKGWRP